MKLPNVTVHYNYLVWDKILNLDFKAGFAPFNQFVTIQLRADRKNKFAYYSTKKIKYRIISTY